MKNSHTKNNEKNDYRKAIDVDNDDDDDSEDYDCYFDDDGAGDNVHGDHDDDDDDDPTARGFLSFLHVLRGFIIGAPRIMQLV